MKKLTDRGNFGSRIGLVLATAGSAVGLGNVWRFPITTGNNGGAAFIIVYFMFVLMLGIPGMLCEFVVGRRSQRNAARSYRNFTHMRYWKYVGYLGILTATIVLGFYAVVAGWCLEYFFASLTGRLDGDAAYVKQYFISFATHPWKPCLWAILFIMMTHLVVVRGVKNGIERASKVLMPLPLVLLVVIVVVSCTLPGAGQGIAFLFHPDFSKVDGRVLVEALGQAFFSLSLGTCCLCTYASYFSKETRLVQSAAQIAVLDTLIAILAGLMIFPAAFSVGDVSFASGDAAKSSLMFTVLPDLFHRAFVEVPWMGRTISILFFALLVFAALTSTISMHEIGTAFFTEERRLPRRVSAWVITAVASVIAIFCSLGNGPLAQVTILGRGILDFCNDITANFMMPAGALLTSIFVGWFASRDKVRDEFTNHGTQSVRLFNIFLITVRWVVPLLIILIFLHLFGVV